MVAYKGGHVEKDLLNKSNIPCLDLESWGCPKFEQLQQMIVETLASCGFHLNDNIHHCPMTECHAFWVMVSNLGQINKQFPCPVIFGKNNIKVG